MLNTYQKKTYHCYSAYQVEDILHDIQMYINCIQQLLHGTEFWLSKFYKLRTLVIHKKQQLPREIKTDRYSLQVNDVGSFTQRDMIFMTSKL